MTRKQCFDDANTFESNTKGRKDQCEEKWKWCCTRPQGHSGPHHAHRSEHGKFSCLHETWTEQTKKDAKILEAL